MRCARVSLANKLEYNRHKTRSIPKDGSKFIREDLVGSKTAVGEKAGWVREEGNETGRKNKGMT